MVQDHPLGGAAFLGTAFDVTEATGEGVGEACPPRVDPAELRAIMSNERYHNGK
jgi:hypothetical protein